MAVCGHALLRGAWNGPPGAGSAQSKRGCGSRQGSRSDPAKRLPGKPIGEPVGGLFGGDGNFGDLLQIGWSQAYA